MATIYNDILQHINPQLEEIVAYNKKIAEDKGLKFTAFEAKWLKLMVSAKLTKSVGKWLNESDQLVTIDTQIDKGCNITINSVCKRGHNEFTFSTEVIYAGGYNIQCLHYRYITKSNLPKNSNNTPKLLLELRLKLKSLTKSKSLEVDIEMYEKRIVKTQAELHILNETSNTEAIERSPRAKYRYSSLSDINPDSHNATIITTEQKLTDFNTEIEESILESLHKKRIATLRDIERLIKSKKKLTIKLEKLEAKLQTL